METKGTTNLLLVGILVILAFSAFYLYDFIESTKRGNSNKNEIPQIIVKDTSKEVAICSATIIISTNIIINCNGGYNGKTNILNMYKNGWRIISDISRADNFLFVFEKNFNTKAIHSYSENIYDPLATKNTNTHNVTTSSSTNKGTSEDYHEDYYNNYKNWSSKKQILNNKYFND